MSSNFLKIIFRYILPIHLLALLLFTILRIILYFVNVGTEPIENHLSLFFKSLIHGLQFDNFVASYMDLLPLLVSIVLSFVPKVNYRNIIKSLNIYYIIVYTIVFAITTANIPYFTYFNNIINYSIFNYLQFGDAVFGMLWGNTSYLFYFLLFILLITSFSFIVIFFGRQIINMHIEREYRRKYSNFIFLVLVIGLTVICLRGSFQHFPLRVGYAYFSNNIFFNKVVINPFFFLLKTTQYMESQDNMLKDIVSKEEALKLVQEKFKIHNPDPDYPINRWVHNDAKFTDENRPNIILILEEGLSFNHLSFEHKGEVIMPYLHSLIKKSYFFNNFYSSGIHTNNGIGSSLSGFPTLIGKTMMEEDPDIYYGLPQQLKERGYQTSFFVSGNPNFDNMQAFLTENAIERVYSNYDFPKKKEVNNWGVADDFLFEFSLEKINEMYKKGKPFFTGIMTISNHMPFVVPPEYKDSGKNDYERIMAFVDNSLEFFMGSAAKEEWYKNTIFIILGDHGSQIGAKHYDIQLSYSHTPLIIYSPLFKDMPQTFEQLGGQIDLYPTIMGLLGYSYLNNSLGIDLFNLEDKREYIYFVNDDCLACVDDQFLYIYNSSTKHERLYKYREFSQEDDKDKYPKKFEDIRKYASSMLSTTQDLVSKKKTKKPQN